MMSLGLQTAFHEITLVLFTTLAPSGALGLVVVAGVVAFSGIDVFERKRVNKFLVLPLAISMVGLVASATHLGTPANALYVFTGVGRSPLSNEVFAAVVFLMLSGLYWLYSFARRPKRMLQNVWLGLIMVTGLIFIGTIAFAYNSHTIIAWNTPYIPLNLALNALVGGPLIALLTLQLARIDLIKGVMGKSLCLVSAVALIANTTSISLQNSDLGMIANEVTSLPEVVPYYWIVMLAFFILSAGGIVLFARPVFRGTKLKLPVSIAACSLVLVGIFLTRFSFYAMHLTSGL